MLEATFIGHQGWLLSSGTARVLIDPLLTGGFGHGGLAGRLYPPRRVHLDAFPSIDAVILTHEHDDHFDIASLQLIDRAVPVYVSSRSSVAMHEFVADLGFNVTAVGPGEDIEIGDELLYRTFAANHVESGGDEWDVLPYIISDSTGEGTFVSSVDVSMPVSMFAELGQSDERVGLLCMANNVTDTRFTLRAAGPLLPLDDDTSALARSFARRWQRVAEVTGPPVLTAICGGGWTHPQDMSWVDSLAFPIESLQLSRRLAAQCRGAFVAPMPGVTYRVEGGVADARRSKFIETLPVVQWPDRCPRAIEIPADFAPACGRRALNDDEVSRLVQGLGEFARFLYGRSLFVALHSVGNLESHPTLCMALRNEGAPIVLRYRPNAGEFVRVEDGDPFTHYVCGYECWASDLLALFEGRIGPTALCYSGRLRCWSRRPDRVRVSPHDLWLFGHPLHRPAVAKTLYETVRAGLPEPAERILRR